MRTSGSVRFLSASGHGWVAWLCMELSFWPTAPSKHEPIRPDGQTSGLVTSGPKAGGWGTAKFWLVAPCLDSAHVLNHMGNRVKKCACSSLLRTPCQRARGWSLYTKPAHNFWALVGWWEALDSILAAPIPVQAAPVQKGPKSLAIPVLPAKQSTEPPLPPSKQPLFNYLAIPFYQSAPWSLPRETCCSPPRPGPWLRMYTQADLSTLFGEWFGVNTRQSLGSLAMKVRCSIPFPEPRHLPSGSEP